MTSLTPVISRSKLANTSPPVPSVIVLISLPLRKPSQAVTRPVTITDGRLSVIVESMVTYLPPNNCSVYDSIRSEIIIFRKTYYLIYPACELLVEHAIKYPNRVYYTRQVLILQHISICGTKVYSPDNFEQFLWTDVGSSILFLLKILFIDRR